MRALTEDEMLLIAGGAGSDTREEDDDRAWYWDAFDWLGDALDWLGDLGGGWMNRYLDGFSDMMDDMGNTGDLVNCHDDWTEYYLDESSNGGDPLSFDEWYGTVDPGTCDTDSGLDPHDPND